MPEIPAEPRERRLGSDASGARGEPTAEPWWRTGVTYQIYPRSFADANGDGTGDIAGIRAHLDYLAGLGIDAIWISPWYPSPMKDAGYDVSDFRDIDAMFGDLAGAEDLILAAHAVGVRVLIDLVPNHTSDQHPWFRQALAADPGAPERDLYFFRDGRGPDGDEPPTDWQSEFGGTAWTRVRDARGRPEQWYLHLFAPEQPDLNWLSSVVREDFERTLRFWFDRGVDGFRIDVAHGLAKDADLRDVGDLLWPMPEDADDDTAHPHWDRPELHEIYRSWRAVADGYSPPRIYTGEVWVGGNRRLMRYLRPDELHTVFNFEYLICPWRADQLRATIDSTVDAHRSVDAVPTWVLANHDVPRIVSRYARPQPLVPTRLDLDELLPLPADFALGIRRARAAALLMLALPGGVFVYQGDELGLPEVEDIAADALQDPIVAQTGGLSRGRDGCRVPLPWSGDTPPYGFSPPDATSPPWLPQPTNWPTMTVASQDRDPESILSLYRRAIRLRREHFAVAGGVMQWIKSPAGTLAFTRGPQLACFVNVEADSMPLPRGAQVLLSSDQLTDANELPTATSAWLRLDQ